MKPDQAIAAVHRGDVSAARALIRAAVDAASARWLPADAVRDAMVQELAALGQRTDRPSAVAAYLRSVADWLDTPPRQQRFDA